MYKRKNILSRILFNAKILTFLGLAIIVLISFPIAKNVSQRHSVNKEIRELEKEIKLVENKNTQLQKLINYLSSDQYVEEQARLNFGLKKGGERAVVIDTSNIPIAPVGGEQSENASGKIFQSMENLSLAGNKKENNLTKSIYNIPGLANVEREKTINNPEKWRRYFFGGS